jgi:lysozyme family protein
MFPSCHPCIDVNEHEFLGGFSHHPREEMTNTKKGITKKMPCYNIGRIKCQSEERDMQNTLNIHSNCIKDMMIKMKRR